MPDSQRTEGATKSWQTATEFYSAGISPARVVESHSQDGNRALYTRSLQVKGYAGHFEFYENMETETVQVDASNVRITTRTFAEDGNRRRTLVEETEETKHTLPGGDSDGVRIFSRSDLNGSLQVIQREIVETKSIGKDVEETNTVVLLPSVNGGFEPAVKIHRLTKRDANARVQLQVTLLRDGAGYWKVQELLQDTTRQEENNLITENRVFRCNAEGKLVEVSRVDGIESEGNPGEKRARLETYSLHIPGTSPNGSLQLVERATTTQRSSANGEQMTEQQVEQRNLGDPSSGLRMSMLVAGAVLPGPSGAQAIRTIRMREADAGFEVIEVDISKSDSVLSIDIANPSKTPK